MVHGSENDDRKLSTLSSVSFNAFDTADRTYDTVDSLSSINSNSLVYDSIQSNQVSILFPRFFLQYFPVIGFKLCCNR